MMSHLQKPRGLYAIIPPPQIEILALIPLCGYASVHLIRVPPRVVHVGVYNCFPVGLFD